MQVNEMWEHLRIPQGSKNISCLPSKMKLTGVNHDEKQDQNCIKSGKIVILQMNWGNKSKKVVETFQQNQIMLLRRWKLITR